MIPSLVSILLRRGSLVPFIQILPPSGGESLLPAACPICDGARTTVRFNWRLAAETPGEFNKYTRTLLEKKSLKSGFLFECPTCGQKWHLDSVREIMTVIPRDKVALVEKWDSAPSFLAPRLFEKAKAIGATAAHRNSLDQDYAEVPCRVLTHQGETIDKCLLSFRKGPPLENYGNSIRLAQEIADIHPSDYALPREVRTASSRSEETRPGRAWTRVESARGAAFNLNWTVNLFDWKGVLGKDIRLPARKAENKPRRLPVIREPMEAITFFIADFNEKTPGLFPLR